MTFLTENKCILQKIFSSDKEQLVTALPTHPGSLAPQMPSQRKSDREIEGFHGTDLHITNL